MAANSFGNNFVVTTFGESHGPALGVVVDGCPGGVVFDEQLLIRELERRRPGGALVSARSELDQPEILSGVFEGQTLGTPIAMLVRNMDARSQDYAGLVSARPGHADDVWKNKFGHADPRGGGRSSGRETVSRVMAGAVARMFLSEALPDFKITGFARAIGEFSLGNAEADLHAVRADQFAARFPSPERGAQVAALLERAKVEGKSYGGVAELWLDGVCAGLGQPVFHKLKSDLAQALMSVGATSGVEVGDGFGAATGEGSEFHAHSDGKYGGIRGGISTGERVVLRVSFKPTSSVLDVAKKGRHDPCIVPRAIPVLEAMCALVIADQCLWSRKDRK